MKTFILTFLVCIMSLCIFAQNNDDPHKTGNVPITFYGKAIDQNNQPVPGVSVEVWTLQGNENYFSSGGYQQRVQTNSLTTDADGDFILENVKGSFIQLNSITKEGYKLSPKQEKRGYRYWPPEFHPDVNNPVIFNMWKKHGAESLTGLSWSGQVACDGTTNRFDLLRGKKNSEGNLKIICNRLPLELPRPGRHPFDYRFEISIIGGGIQRTEDEFTYVAPENGYEPKLIIEQKANDPHWHGRVKQEFYIKTEEGHYGRLSVDWYASQMSPTHLDWDCSINPSGSQNLER